MGGVAWKAAVHGVAESQTRLNDFTFTFHFHALEKEMATSSSVLAWRIPGTGEPGGLPSMGSHSRTRLKRLSSSSSSSSPMFESSASLVAQRLKRLPSMRETWVQFLGWEDALEKEMATHSSILAWKIPQTEEPVGLHTVHRAAKSWI